VAHAEGAAVVQLRTRNPAATPRIRSLGFLPATPSVRFMVAARDDVAQHDLLVDPAAWFVTSGDADLEFVELSRVELDY
jgi:hypothetical protein